MTNTLKKTVVIPADRRLYVDIPPDMPTGSAEITVRVSVNAAPQDGVCPLCARYHEPNAETIAAIEEGRAMTRGEIPSRLYHSVEEMLADMDAEDE